MEAKTLGDLIFTYEKFAQAENKSERTIEAVTAAATKFDSFLGGNTNLWDITAHDLRRYILHLQERNKWSDHPTIQKNHGNLSSNTIAHHVRQDRVVYPVLQLPMIGLIHGASPLWVQLALDPIPTSYSTFVWLDAWLSC